MSVPNLSYINKHKYDEISDKMIKLSYSKSALIFSIPLNTYIWKYVKHTAMHLFKVKMEVNSSRLMTLFIGLALPIDNHSQTVNDTYCSQRKYFQFLVLLKFQQTYWRSPFVLYSYSSRTITVQLDRSFLL